MARRLAHEIKNPLTPIQLSAERLQIKLADKLAPAERAMLERSTQTIVNQVEALKNMGNDFRDYARLPPPTIAPLALNALVGEVLGLYEHARVPVDARLDPAQPRVMGDMAQLRQVIDNLLRNAEDALGEAQEAQIEVLIALAAIIISGRKISISRKLLSHHIHGWDHDVVHDLFRVQTISQGLPNQWFNGITFSFNDGLLKLFFHGCHLRHIRPP